MLPPEPVLRAACRWLDLLQRSPLPTARALIRAELDHRELTFTQYSTALDWLTASGLLLPDGTNQLAIAPEALGLDSAAIGRLLFLRSIEHDAPAWLPDADLLINDPAELPDDAAQLAVTLGLDDSSALAAVRQVHGKIDLAERSRVGAIGEAALVQLLEAEWPGSVVHLALEDDGLGYDVLLRLAGRSWHLEVKSTTRKGRSIIHLSRHEFNVAQLDDQWRLLLVRLDQTDALSQVNTVNHLEVFKHAPRDVATSTTWESARFDVSQAQQSNGLSFLGENARFINTATLLPH